MSKRSFKPGLHTIAQIPPVRLGDLVYRQSDWGIRAIVALSDTHTRAEDERLYIR